jgi:hypothetical protein
VSVPPLNKFTETTFDASARELPGSETGVGTEWFFEHWHAPRCESAPPLPQQGHVVPVVLQQLA